MIEFRMPSLGADMEDGVLVEWLVKPGDAIKAGDVVAVVETQKGAIEIETFDPGVLDSQLVEPGATVPVGAPLALIRAADEPPNAQAPARSAPAPEAPAAPTAPPAPVAAAPPVVQVEASGALPRLRVSPAARRLAAERGIDLSKVTGTGPGGAIQLADLEAPPKAAPRPAGFDFTQMRAAIAAAMSRSKREIPHYYLIDTVDIQASVEWVARINAERPPDRRLLLGALYLKAAAVAARAYPEFNGAFEAGAFRPGQAVHVGMAISIRGGGLAAPAIHDTADLALDELMARMRDLVGRVRAGRFRSSEIADPTITVSSLGDRGVEALFGVIYPPQVAILGFGKVVERPWVVEGAVTARSVLTITLAADHRVSDGHRGALFLAEVGRLLQHPEAL
ncbi:MAG TPA: dihydrolipoamide acetyltransferase family protein [Phenylobacterium sp.]|nr:dihydrolipoamide acetyltransferase family protein [Phenylobacterium sp.]